MLDEPAKRRANFTQGATIALADGQVWTLAASESLLHDVDFQALLLGLREAESFADLLRAEFALGIDLLTRNYDLTSVELQILFGFARNSPELSMFQDSLHKVAMERPAGKFGGAND